MCSLCASSKVLSYDAIATALQVRTGEEGGKGREGGGGGTAAPGGLCSRAAAVYAHAEAAPNFLCVLRVTTLQNSSLAKGPFGALYEQA